MFTTGNKEELFTQLTLAQNSQYYVAQLSLGNHFYQQTLLLKMYDPHDEQQTYIVEIFTNTNQNENKIFPQLLAFENNKSGVMQTFSPYFYCVKQNIFFHARKEKYAQLLAYHESDHFI